MLRALRFVPVIAALVLFTAGAARAEVTVGGKAPDFTLTSLDGKKVSLHDFAGKTVVLTAGTFLSGKIHVGLENYTGGRAGDRQEFEVSHVHVGKQGHRGPWVRRLATVTSCRVCSCGSRSLLISNVPQPA